MENIDVSILTVNYNTPFFLIGLLESIEKFYPNLKVYIVDGSDKKEEIKKAKRIVKGKKNVVLYSLGKNIHHGPGLHYGIKKIKNKYILLIDSDSLILKDGLIENLYSNLKDGYGTGIIEYIDDKGKNVAKGQGIPYLHPRCALIAKAKYLQYKPAIKHGAPFIETMTDIFAHGDAGTLIEYDDIDTYYHHIGSGTVTHTGGYNFKPKKSYLHNKVLYFIKRVKMLLGKN